eukprot:CAMPEP_0116887858 /NCGR_PEP_ID=MMETSP0463-20121206/22563_1 /TAXON_ID=181622 /ORGANISM="Strombidinopsis sp, Strain SopsisLIS2011" /LENGTH=62 /DNA_ID=CAMNT_0004551409 /DNA_START=135 /DNA_END=323 /DNA_ORIENTATION=+
MQNHQNQNRSPHNPIDPQNSNDEDSIMIDTNVNSYPDLDQPKLHLTLSDQEKFGGISMEEAE